MQALYPVHGHAPSPSSATYGVSIAKRCDSTGNSFWGRKSGAISEQKELPVESKIARERVAICGRRAGLFGTLTRRAMQIDRPQF